MQWLAAFTLVFAAANAASIDKRDSTMGGSCQYVAYQDRKFSTFTTLSGSFANLAACINMLNQKSPAYEGVAYNPSSLQCLGTVDAQTTTTIAAPGWSLYIKKLGSGTLPSGWSWWDWLVSGFNTVVADVKNALPVISGGITVQVGNNGQQWSETFGVGGSGDSSSWLQKIKDGIVDVASDVKAGAQVAGTTIANAAATAGNAITNVANKAGTAISNAATTVGNDIKNVASTAWNDVNKLFGG